MDASQTIVITKRSSCYATALQRLRPDQTVVDLVRLLPADHDLGGQYHALVG